MSGDYRGKGRVVFLVAIMVLSVFAMTTAFAGSAAADVTDLTNEDVSNVTVGQETVTQTVEVDVTTDAGDENVTIDPSSASSIEDSDLVSVDSATGSDNLTVQEFGIVSSAVEVNVTGNGSTDNPDGTLTVDYTLDTTGIATSSEESISVSEPDSTTVNPNFDLTAPDSITVATDNGNGLQYAVNNVAEDGTVTVESGVTYNGDLDIETEGITLEGPNAGVDGNSERAEEAVINGVVTAGQSVPEFGNITIDGFTIEATPDESREFPDKGVLMLSESGDLVGDNVIKNNIITVDGSDTNDGAVAGAYIDGNSDLELSFKNNLFNDSSDTGTVTQAITQAQTPVSSVNVTDNTIKTEGSIWLQADGDVTGTISGNEFTDTITEQDAVRVSQFGSGAVDVDILENEFNATYSTYIDQKDSGEVNVDIQENNFNSEVAVGTQINEAGSGAVDVDILENNYDISASNFGVYFTGNIDVSDSDSVNISRNNFEPTSITAVDASAVTGTVDATSNWWGSTDGPSGDFNGNGAGATGSVSVDPANVTGIESGDVTLESDFLGIVQDDADSINVTETSGADINIDNALDTPANGTLVVDINGTEYVFEDALVDGELVNTESTKGPADIDEDATTSGTADIDVVGDDSTTAVAQAGTVDLVHEVRDLDEGFTLTSIPQPAEIHQENIVAVNQWNTGDGSYDAGLPDGVVDNAEDLHRGHYVEGANDDARIGYEFETTTEQATPSQVELESGWHLASSAFAIDEEGGNRNIDTDMGNIELTQSGATAYDPGQTQITDISGYNVNAFDTYWVFIDNPDQDLREIPDPDYSPSDRDGIVNKKE